MIARRHAARLIMTVAALALMALTMLVGSANPAAAAPNSDESGFLAATNAFRQQNGLGALQYDAALSDVARGWTQQMANSRTLAHNGALVAQVNATVTNQWTRIGENVGYGPAVDSIQNAFYNSPP